SSCWPMRGLRHGGSAVSVGSGCCGGAFRRPGPTREAASGGTSRPRLAPPRPLAYNRPPLRSHGREELPRPGPRLDVLMTPAHAPTEGTPPVRRCLVALVAAVCRPPRLVLVLAALVCALSAVSAAVRLEYRTQRNDLISARKECLQRWRAYLDEFGDDDDMV